VSLDTRAVNKNTNFSNPTGPLPPDTVFSDVLMKLDDAHKHIYITLRVEF